MKDLSKLKVNELKDLLEARGLSIRGLKKDLIERLQEVSDEDKQGQQGQQEQQGEQDKQERPEAEDSDKKRSERSEDEIEESKRQKIEAKTEETPQQKPDLEEEQELKGGPEHKSVPKSEPEPENLPEHQPELEDKPEDKPEHKPEHEPEHKPEPERESEQQPESGIEQKRDSEIETKEDRALLQATKRVFVRGLSRPMPLNRLKEHIYRLVDGESNVRNFHIDALKSHIFVTVTSVDAAQKLRDGMHGTSFPPEERGRPVLFANYIPEDAALDEWIRLENEVDTSARFDLEYGKDADGNTIVTHVDMVTRSPYVKGEHKEEREQGQEQQQEQPQKLGTLEMRMGDAESAAPRKVLSPDELFRRTETQPFLYYMPFNDDIAQSRLKNVRSNA